MQLEQYFTDGELGILDRVGGVILGTRLVNGRFEDATLETTFADASELSNAKELAERLDGLDLPQRPLYKQLLQRAMAGMR